MPAKNPRDVGNRIRRAIETRLATDPQRYGEPFGEPSMITDPDDKLIPNSFQAN
jgi:hypothetical protein